MPAHPGKAVGGGAINKAKTHCANGHEYTPENTAWVRKPTGMGRNCIICRKASNDKSYSKRKTTKPTEL